MIYKVVRNGETILVTHSYKNAANTYDEEIRKADDRIIISMYCRRDGTKDWELARKDWL